MLFYFSINENTEEAQGHVLTFRVSHAYMRTGKIRSAPSNGRIKLSLSNVIVNE